MNDTDMELDNTCIPINPEDEVKFPHSPKPTCKLRPFGDNTIEINLIDKPNLWHRIWYRLFFGWKFEEIKP